MELGIIVNVVDLDTVGILSLGQGVRKCDGDLSTELMDGFVSDLGGEAVMTSESCPW